MKPPQSQIGWMRWLPGLVALREYQARWLPNEIVDGLVLATMLIPVGMASALASAAPGIYGLYATVVPLLAYAVFGPSRILVLGPDSSLAAVILGVVAPLAAGDPGRAVALAGMMAIVSGLVCILAGVARLGFVTDLLSKPNQALSPCAPDTRSRSVSLGRAIVLRQRRTVQATCPGR